MIVVTSTTKKKANFFVRASFFQKTKPPHFLTHENIYKKSKIKKKYTHIEMMRAYFFSSNLWLKVTSNTYTTGDILALYTRKKSELVKKIMTG